MSWAPTLGKYPEFVEKRRRKISEFINGLSSNQSVKVCRPTHFCSCEDISELLFVLGEQWIIDYSVLIHLPIVCIACINSSLRIY